MSELVPEIIEGERLSVAEEKRLTELEGVIEKNFKGFVAVGTALAEIRDRRLYREYYKAFEDYCLNIWDVHKNTANQYIAASKVVENLTAIAVKNDSDDKCPLPANEAQARELAKLPPEEQIAVWQNLISDIKKSGAKITAKTVKKAVLTYKGEAIDKQIESAKEEIRKNRTEPPPSGHSDRQKAEKPRESPEFIEAFDRFFDQIRIEREANWRYTSRKNIHNILLGLVEVVAEAVPGTLEEYGCAMELSDREKLKKAGFRIFRMDAKHLLIEEFLHGNSWAILAECKSPKQLNDSFKRLLEDHMHLRG